MHFRRLYTTIYQKCIFIALSHENIASISKQTKLQETQSTLITTLFCFRKNNFQKTGIIKFFGSGKQMYKMMYEMIWDVVFIAPPHSPLPFTIFCDLPTWRRRIRSNKNSREGGKKDGKTFSSFILEGDLSFYNPKIHICNIINGKTK